MSERDRQRLRAVIAAYGADARRWPAADRAALTEIAAAEDAAFDKAREIDLILSSASAPQDDERSMTRILQAIEADRRADDSKVLTFPAIGRPRSSISPWLTALPLAASLAIGFYFGARGTLDAILPAAIVGDVAAVGDDPSDLSGVSDMEELAGDDTT